MTAYDPDYGKKVEGCESVQIGKIDGQIYFRSGGKEMTVRALVQALSLIGEKWHAWDFVVENDESGAPVQRVEIFEEGPDGKPVVNIL